MNTTFKTAVAIAVGTLFAGAALAQSNREIEQRDRNEQARIDRGIQSGQITPREADRLQGERARIERLEQRARADGNLSGNERARIDRAQDRLGRDIYRESHDRQTSIGAGRPGDNRGNNREDNRGNHGGWSRGNERGNDHQASMPHAEARSTQNQAGRQVTAANQGSNNGRRTR